MKKDGLWLFVPLFGLLWLVGRLPVHALHRLADALAWLYRRLQLREWRVARRNLTVCFPNLTPAEQTDLLNQTLRAAAATALECARFWTRPAAQNLVYVREIEGLELLDAALTAKEGLIVAAPHLGNWELLSQFLASRAPLTIVYRAPRQAGLETLLRRGRALPGLTQVRAEPAAVRALLRTLARGGTLGILPDQQPKRGEGEFAPFFGQPALTMTLLPRLAARTGARVLFAFAERLPGSAGFAIRFFPAPPGIDDADPRRATAALNRGIELCAARALPQYQWTYKRFSIRREGESFY